MTDFRRWTLALGIPLTLVSGCADVEFTHVKPGQSAHLEVLTRTAPHALPIARAVPEQKRRGGFGQQYAAIEPLPLDVSAPGLPDTNTMTVRAQQLLAQGEAAMQAGQTGEAILALEEAVRVDPSLAQGWSKLEHLYKSAGQGGKASEAASKAREASTGTNALIPSSSSL